MAASPAIIVTAVPNCVGSDGSLGNQVGMKLKAMNAVWMCNSNIAVANKMLIPESCVQYTGCEASQGSIPNRKRKLDHLNLEEKRDRKKLKNRVSAQNSRDRKKARLDDLEAEVKALRDKNVALTMQCHNLHLEKTRLATENHELLQKLSNVEYNHQTHDVSFSTQVEPAKFSIDPLLQGQALQLAVPGASGLDSLDNPEVPPSCPDLMDIADEDDISQSRLDELAQSLFRKAKQGMDTEHRQASAEVGTYGFQGKSSFSTQVGLAEFSIDPLLQGQALQLAVPGASGLDSLDNPEVPPSCPDLLDNVDGDDISQSGLDELAQSLFRKAKEGMDTEHRQASAEVGTYGFQGKSSCNQAVGSSPEDVETNRKLITSAAALKFTEQDKATSLCIPDIQDFSLCLLPNQKDTCDTSPESVFDTYDEIDSYYNNSNPSRGCMTLSLDSPESEISGDEFVDTWNESFPLLFPTLV